MYQLIKRRSGRPASRPVARIGPRRGSGIARRFALLLLCLPFGVNAQDFRVLHTLDVRWDQDGDHFTPIVSDDDGNLYFAFVNDRNKVVIGKKPVVGLVQTVQITPLMTKADRSHATPSIALDRNGYIHVFGPMHNTDMDYWRSVLPFDITAGFARRKAAHAETAEQVIKQTEAHEAELKAERDRRYAARKNGKR